MFLDEKEQHFSELNDDDWLCKLMFLADITKHLNDLNLRLQGQGQTVFELFEHWKGFASKLDYFAVILPLTQVLSKRKGSFKSIYCQQR